MNIFIIGLGLMGGSLAKSLNGFHNADIYGVNRTKKYLETAENEGVIKKGYTLDEGECIKDADIIILCLYPKLNVEFIKKYSRYLKDGCIITDVSGVKTYIEKEMLAVIPENVDFIGGHPMAGKEVGGYENTDAELYNGASYLIVPSKRSREENVSLIAEMAYYIGVGRVIRTTAEKHDEIIAYTSQLMHIIAASICNMDTVESASGFAGGSMRDMTRIANINENLWSELFMENSDALVRSINNLQMILEKFKNAIENNDKNTVTRLLALSRENKLKWLNNR